MDAGTANTIPNKTESIAEQATKSPAQTSSISPLLAQIGVDPVTGIETTLSLFAFTAENEDELSFPANELIRIVEKDQEYNDGWYRGKNQKGEEGLFPASYVLPTGADPKPYLEMQQAPQPLNISNSKSGPGTPVGETVAEAGEGVAGPTGLGIGGVVTEAKTEAPRPDSPVKSLSRPRSTLSLQSQDSGRVQIPPAASTHGETNDNNNIRARLAEQARLENEKKERNRADEEAAERDDEEQTGKGFARFGALGAGKTAEPARRLDQIQEKDKVETPVDTRAGLEPSAPIIAPAGSGFSGGNPHEWGVAEVVEWARSRGFDDAICEKFAEHEITGDVLLELDANLLKELEIPQFGKRIKIANAIADLRRPQSTLSMGNASNRSSTGLVRGPSMTQMGGLGSAGASPTVLVGGYPTSPTGTPASGNYGEWAHSRKSSVSTSLVNAPIREEDESGKRDHRPPSVHQSITPDAPTSGMLPPTDSHHRANSIRSIASSIPSSPQTPNTKRNSTEQRALFGHKKAKSSLDGTRPPSERMSFFGGTIGRNRKPAPSAPTNRITKSSIGPATAPVHGNQRVSQGTPAPAALSSSPTTPMRTPSAAVDRNESSAMSKIGKPDFAGYMKKKGERYNTWKNRYFVLKGAHLYYMKSPQEDKVKGHIDLAGYKVLSDPNAGSGFGFQLVHDREKTHFFASNEHRVIKDWMKNLMKATISRDYSAPVVSSCNIPTIPLREAQMLAPRPPSPGQREAAQRAARRDDPNKLTPRDASVLMSLEGSPTAGKRSTLGPGMSAPGRPSRDLRRPSEGRPGTTVRVTPMAPSARLGDTSGLLDWFNARLPFDLPERATSLSSSFADGKLVTRLIETYCHPESSSAIPAEEAIFTPVAPGEPNLEGLFTMMDKCIDEGVDTVGVSINDVRLGHEEETARLLVSLKGWIEQREREGR
ncbi:hypothetical protein FFLO_04850 [Filobasidium floriforme]|uniref:Uncharacterized protein n=1 Tax=Filobasidium floriforme TaxID=5210 RepID=A0A8K0JNG9_9TREE|nr:uncharacterized protein HD553DRAFT_278437 [Filobasidium floriforme]KAG7530680.1 hypothetical protein FFLO_04850 [Filobasidium floriforme]KAH8077819.1 hypothetical protein HD553DRAFT_278437 [Filobasidium floriforme]